MSKPTIPADSENVQLQAQLALQSIQHSKEAIQQRAVANTPIAIEILPSIGFGLCMMLMNIDVPLWMMIAALAFFLVPHWLWLTRWRRNRPVIDKPNPFSIWQILAKVMPTAFIGGFGLGILLVMVRILAPKYGIGIHGLFFVLVVALHYCVLVRSMNKKLLSLRRSQA